jgi:hypothetical protein
MITIDVMKNKISGQCKAKDFKKQIEDLKEILKNDRL